MAGGQDSLALRTPHPFVKASARSIVTRVFETQNKCNALSETQSFGTSIISMIMMNRMSDPHQPTEKAFVQPQTGSLGVWMSCAGKIDC